MKSTQRSPVAALVPNVPFDTWTHLFPNTAETTIDWLSAAPHKIVIRMPHVPVDKSRFPSMKKTSTDSLPATPHAVAGLLSRTNPHVIFACDHPVPGVGDAP